MVHDACAEAHTTIVPGEVESVQVGFTTTA